MAPTKNRNFFFFSDFSRGPGSETRAHGGLIIELAWTEHGPRLCSAALHFKGRYLLGEIVLGRGEKKGGVGVLATATSFITNWSIVLSPVAYPIQHYHSCTSTTGARLTPERAAVHMHPPTTLTSERAARGRMTLRTAVPAQVCWSVRRIELFRK